MHCQLCGGILSYCFVLHRWQLKSRDAANAWLGVGFPLICKLRQRKDYLEEVWFLAYSEGNRIRIRDIGWSCLESISACLPRGKPRCEPWIRRGEYSMGLGGCHLLLHLPHMIHSINFDSTTRARATWIPATWVPATGVPCTRVPAMLVNPSILK